MISERILAAKFPAFWQELIPLLTPRFVRIFNETEMNVLLDYEGIPCAPIPSEGVDDPAIIAEMAFHLAKICHETNISNKSKKTFEKITKKAHKKAIDLIRLYEGTTPDNNYRLQSASIEEAQAMASRYRLLPHNLKLDSVAQFSPSFAGAGFLDACSGDLLIGGILLEIKTVTRNISGRDFRQLIVYLALQSHTQDKRIKTGGFFNPKRGLLGYFDVDDLIFRLSGGRTPADVYGDLIDYVSDRNILLEAEF